MLKFMLTSPHAKAPVVLDDLSPGVELFATEPMLIDPGQQVKVNTHVVFEFPPSKIGLVMDKSSVVTKQHLKVQGGVIDPGYRGDIIVILHNFGERVAFIDRGYPVAQMLLIPCLAPTLQHVDSISTNTFRGERGFGGVTLAVLGSKLEATNT